MKDYFTEYFKIIKESLISDDIYDIAGAICLLIVVFLVIPFSIGAIIVKLFVEPSVIAHVFLGISVVTVSILVVFGLSYIIREIVKSIKKR